jgi:hypothetical protein
MNELVTTLGYTGYWYVTSKHSLLITLLEERDNLDLYDSWSYFHNP